MEFKINLKPINIILKNHNLENDGKANKILRDTIDRMSDPYIPMTVGSGVHMKSQKNYPNNHSIKYTAPYSKYQYYGKLMLAKNGSSYAKLGEKKTLSNEDLQYTGAPKRGARWDKRMWQDKGKEICKDLEGMIKNGEV